MNDKKYFVGLDMGTNSVGWAVTDTDYKLLRAKGKDMWGIREFDEANSAADRRTQRVSRRRRERECARIGLLKEYFEEEINKVDPGFYVRLENSKFFPEDKDDRLGSSSVNGVFDDPDYTDKEYYSQYPTIFHLRKELIKNRDKHDVRLVFLALLNMFKHRGHFLDSSSDIEGDIRSPEEVFADISRVLSEENEVFIPNTVSATSVIEVLKSREYSRSAKADRLLEVLSLDKKDKKIIQMICGLSVKSSTIFPEFSQEEDITFSFSGADWDEKREELVAAVGEEAMSMVDLSYELYCIGMLSSILGEYDYLSEARVASYEEHKKDLRILKDIFKRYGSKDGKDYDQMFRLEEKGSYSAYVNSTNTDHIKEGNSKRGVCRRGMSVRSRDDLYKTIKGYFKKWNLDESSDDENVVRIYERMASEQFLPKQLTSSNGVIPNQIHKREMKKILENAEAYLPFLSEKDETGLSVSERIVQLFSFHIPYYVGPMSEKSESMNGNGWVVRKEEGKVLPWNLESKVDLPKTRERFIERLIRECTYLHGEKVLPKASLLYEKYCVLNEINNIRISGERLDPQIKKDMYNELYMSGKRVTKKKITTWLKNRGRIEAEEQMSGLDISVNNQLSSYTRFYGVFGDDMKKDEYIRMVEDIVRWGTIYGDAKKVLKEYLLSEYGDKIDEKQMKRILGFKFKDWTRLSRAFLELEGTDRTTGEVITMISALWNTNLNMMELIHSDQYSFGEELEKKEKKAYESLYDFTKEDLDEMYFSAPVRRMIWQTIKVLKEIGKILGCPPTRVFLEMTRQPDDKKERKDSRGKQLLELYKSIKDENKEWAREQLDKIKQAEDDGSLRSKKLFLYYTQMGRDMYTGKPIDLSDLLQNNIYDIDHIYPQHFVKDDNLANNMVLVNKKDNIDKKDEYPLIGRIRNNPQVCALWDMLRKNKLINEEKYRRLTRATGFSEEEQAGFIARQLVETSQGTKGVADLLKSIYDPKKTTIVYAKARNVSEFRHQFDFPKSRLVNDFHHANDAYLNIVVGNAYFVKFTQNPQNFIRKEYSRDKEKYKYNLNRMFDWDVRRGEEVAWIAPKKDNAGSIQTVRKMMNKNTPLLTRLSYERKGTLFDEMPINAKTAKADVYIPLKSEMEVEKYGGYNKPKRAYFFLVEHTKGNKRIRTLETVPVLLRDSMKEEGALEEYCKTIGLIEPSIRIRKIKMNSLIKVNGYICYITGVGGNQISLANGVNLCLNQEYVKYIKRIENLIAGTTDNIELFSKERNIALYDELIKKHNDSVFSKKPNPIGEKLKIKREKYLNLRVYDQCQVLHNILLLSSIGGRVTDLSLIGESKQCGKLMIGKNVSGLSEMLLICESATGLYSSFVDLLTV